MGSQWALPGGELAHQALRWGPRLRGECSAAWSPWAPWRTAPCGGQRCMDRRGHCARWHNQGTSSCNCVSACGKGWGRRGKGGNAPPSRDVLIDRVKDRFSWRHSQTDRHAHTQIHRHPHTRENHPASVWGLKTAVRQTHTSDSDSKGNSARGEGSRGSHSCSHTSAGRGEDRNSVPVWVGAGRLGQRLQTGPQARALLYLLRGPSLPLAPRGTSETLRSGGWAPSALSQSWRREGTHTLAAADPLCHSFLQPVLGMWGSQKPR